MSSAGVQTVNRVKLSLRGDFWPPLPADCPLSPLPSPYSPVMTKSVGFQSYCAGLSGLRAPPPSPATFGTMAKDQSSLVHDVETWTKLLKASMDRQMSNAVAPQ